MNNQSLTNERTFLGHPRALFLLFSVEMWERFSYYGMRALLVLFLTNATLTEGFGWNSVEALRLYGTYTGLVYITPLFGGWIADNVIGNRRAIIIGGVLMALGHFLMAGPALVPAYFSEQTGTDVQALMVESGVPMGESLDTLVGGQTVLERLTAEVASRGLDSVAANALVESVSLAYQGIGWTFYAALALIIIGNGFFKPNISTMVGLLYKEGDHRRDAGFTIFYMGINLGAFFGSLLCGYLGEVVGWHWGFSAAGVGMVFGLVLMLALQASMLGNIGVEAPNKHLVKVKHEVKPLTSVEFDRIKTIMILSIFTIIFWSGFEQAGGAMNLYAFEKTDRSLLGGEVPASWFQSLNALFIIIFAPIIAALWVKLGDREPGSATKFAMGFGLLAMGFLAMVGAAIELSMTGKSSMMWLVLAYLFHTLGELCLSPVGLSMVTKLAPIRLGALFMGVWFFASALGNKLSGFIGGYTETAGPLSTFAGITIVSALAGVLLFLFSNKLVQWTHGAEGSQSAPLDEELQVIGKHEGIK